MSNRNLIDRISSSKIGSMVMGILSILIGVFFICYVNLNPDSAKGFTFLGIFAVVAGAFILVFTVMQIINGRKQKKNKSSRTYGAIRRADTDVKHRILLEAETDGMKICYRRVKRVNELVINGKVYDEMRAVIEFEHVLTGRFGNHTVEAGLDEDSYSFICVDSVRIAEKKRLV